MNRDADDLEALLERVENHDKLIASLTGSLRGQHYVLLTLIGTHHNPQSLKKVWRDASINAVDFEMENGQLDEAEFRRTFMVAIASAARLIDVEAKRRRRS